MPPSCRPRIAAAIGLALLLASAAAAAPLNGPPDPLARYEPGARRPAKEASADGLALLFRFYQEYVGANRGWQCPMEPSCSEYSRLAFARHGLLRGLGLTTDRLLRCGSDTHLYPLVESSRGLAYGDPVP